MKLYGGIDLHSNNSVVALTDEQDRVAFNLLVVSVYDYDNDGVLTRDDPRYLVMVLAGDTQCSRNYVCDLDNDGFVCDEDLALYTSLVYNYDNPVVESNVAGKVFGGLFGGTQQTCNDLDDPNHRRTCIECIGELGDCYNPSTDECASCTVGSAVIKKTGASSSS